MFTIGILLAIAFPAIVLICRFLQGKRPLTISPFEAQEFSGLGGIFIILCIRQILSLIVYSAPFFVYLYLYTPISMLALPVVALTVFMLVFLFRRNKIFLYFYIAVTSYYLILYTLAEDTGRLASTAIIEGLFMAYILFSKRAAYIFKLRPTLVSNPVSPSDS